MPDARTEELPKRFPANSVLIVQFPEHGYSGTDKRRGTELPASPRSNGAGPDQVVAVPVIRSCTIANVRYRMWANFEYGTVRNKLTTAAMCTM